MADINIRKLPAGIQSFKTIREEGYVYVDKSDIVWYLANCGKLFNYLSRPRRFGKSILVDTLQMYFEGRKELFEGLKIMQLEKEWKQYPVIRLDLSRGGANAETLRSYLDLRFKEYEKKYAITLPSTAHIVLAKVITIIILFEVVMCLLCCPLVTNVHSFQLWLEVFADFLLSDTTDGGVFRQETDVGQVV